MAEPETVHDDPVLRTVNARNVQVNVWLGAPTIVQVRAFGRASAALARKHPRGTALVNLMMQGKASFSEEVRDELVKQMKLDTFRLGAAHVVLASGLTGTAVRAFLSTVILLGRPGIPTKVFSDTKSAAAWHLPLLAQGAEAWTLAELTALLEKTTPR
jgi:hypothetical protein